MCAGYLTDFISFTEYRVHTLGSIKTVPDYLSEFDTYENGATKAANNAARERSKEKP